MAKYGQCKFGQGLYGAKPCLKEGVNYWFLQIDWAGDDTWVGVDQVSEYILTNGVDVQRGRENKINPGGAGFGKMPVGICTLKLRNDTGIYNAYNVASALYPNVGPEKKFKLDYQKGYSGDRLPVFTGYISNIEPQRLNGIDSVIITGEDGARRLRDENANIALSEGIGTGDAIEDILDYIGWDDSTSLEAGADTIDYWWISQKNAANAVHELAISEMGEFYIAKDGTATYYGRHHVYTAAVTLTGADISPNPLVRQPWEVVKNVVNLTVSIKKLQATAELWRLQDTPSVSSGDSLEVWGNYTYDNRYVAGKTILCQATTDYTANTQSGGGGDDLTADFTVTITNFGTSAKMVIDNDSAQNGYVTLLKLRGDAIDEPDETTVTNSSGTGNAVFTEYLPWLQDVNTAVDLAGFLAFSLSEDSFYPVIEMETDAEQQIEFELMEKITLTIADYSIDDDYRIGKIRHQTYGGGGGIVHTTLWLEPPFSDLDGMWKFPVEMGVTSVFAY